jgi:rhodanese-related sulfurtransferase
MATTPPCDPIDMIEARAYPEDQWAIRLMVAAAVIFALMVVLAASLPNVDIDNPAWNRHVSMSCRSSACLTPAQFLTSDQAAWMKRQTAVLVVDIRAPTEPANAFPRLESDAHVVFMQRGTVSAANAIARSPGMEIRMDFGTNVDDALRAARLKHDAPVMLVSQSMERSMLAALLLQERGYSRVFIVRD